MKIINRKLKICCYILYSSIARNTSVLAFNVLRKECFQSLQVTPKRFENNYYVEFGG